MFQSKGNSLNIVLDERCFYLRPSVQGTPSEDTVVRGSLTLSLSKPKRIKSLSIRLVCDYGLESGPEEYRTEYGQKVITEVMLQDESLERVYVSGDHTFMFSVIIPSSTAPYERGEYGWIEHKLVATARGEGVFKPNIESSLPILLIANPAPIGETSEFHARKDGFREELGPYTISTDSQHLTVGGLLSVSYTLASVPSRLHVISASAYLNTTYTVKSMTSKAHGDSSKPKELARHSRRTVLFNLDASKPWKDEDSEMVARQVCGAAVPRNVRTSHRHVPMGGAQTSSSVEGIQVVPRGGSFSLHHLARLPPDNAVRPSTLEGTDTPIEVHHEILIRLVFSRDSNDDDECEDMKGKGRNGLPLILSVTQPIVLSSCCLTIPSLLVPSYSEAYASCPSDSQFGHPHYFTAGCASRNCICTMTKASLVDIGKKADVRYNPGSGGRDYSGSDLKKI